MDLLNNLNEYWGVLTAILAFVVTFVRMEMAIKNINEKDIRKETQFNTMKSDMESTHENMQKDITGVKEEMANENKLFALEFKKIEIGMERLTTTIEFIKSEVTRK